MSLPVIMRGLFQSSRQQQSGLTDWLLTLVQATGSSWAGYWDISVPGGALNTAGQPVTSQGGVIHRIPNLLPGMSLGDWLFDAEAFETLMGVPLPPGRGSTAAYDRTITYGNGQQYPNIPMSRVPISLWDAELDTAQNIANTFSFFTLTASALPGENVRGVTQVLITSFLAHELSALGTGSPIAGVSVPPAMAEAPAVMIVTVDFVEATSSGYVNGAPFDVGEAAGSSGGEGGITPTPEAMSDMLMELGMTWGTPCTACQKIALLPFPLAAHEIASVTATFAENMEA